MSTLVGWSAVSVAVAVAVAALLALSLGLTGSVVAADGMSGSLGRGALVLAEGVPSADLRVGDAVVVDRAVAEGDDALRGAAAGQVARLDERGVHVVDERGELALLPLDQEQMRVSGSLPLLGYPLLAPWWVVVLGLGLLGLAALCRVVSVVLRTRPAVGLIPPRTLPGADVEPVVAAARERNAARVTRC